MYRKVHSGYTITRLQTFSLAHLMKIGSIKMMKQNGTWLTIYNERMFYPIMTNTRQLALKKQLSKL